MKRAKIIVVNICFLLVIGAFAGGISAFAMPVDDGVGINSSGAPARGAVCAFVDATDGISLTEPVDSSGLPYGNVTMYNTVAIDTAITPEEYLGYIDDPSTGMTYNMASTYTIVNQDFGSKMASWETDNPYIMVAEVNPDEAGGHSPDATQNYSASTSAQVWSTDGQNFGINFQLEPLPAATASESGADNVITWTDMSAVGNDVGIEAYEIWSSASQFTGYTYLGEVTVGTQTYTDAGAAGNNAWYAIKPRYEGGYHIFGLGIPDTAAAAADNPPVANAGPDQTVDEDVAVTFDGSGSTDDNGIASYSWTFDDGGPQTLTTVNPTYIFNTPGVYTVTLTVTDTIGQTDTDTVIITVNDVTAPTANAGPNDTSEFGTSYTFDGSGSTDNVGVTNYTWTFTDGVAVELYGVAPSYQFSALGVFTVTLTVSDDAGLTGTDTVDITVSDTTPITITDNTAATVDPNSNFYINCTASDAQDLVAGSVTLYYEDTNGTEWGPLTADSFMGVSDNQITKADNNDNQPMDTRSYSWELPAVMNSGNILYYFATDDGAGNLATDPAGADLVAGSGNHYSILAQAGDTPSQTHPVAGYVLDALGNPIAGVDVWVNWTSGGTDYSNYTTTLADGWYQIDLTPNPWNATDNVTVYAQTYISGVMYNGTNWTLIQAGDNILPDDDMEYVNVTVALIDVFELKWTLGWNIWSVPMIWTENASSGFTQDWTFSDFAYAHYNDTNLEPTFADECTLVHFDGVAYVTYVHPLDAGGANDLVVNGSYGYWAFVEESWFTDEVTLGLTEEGLYVTGQYVWRHIDTRNVAVDAGWNLLGWNSFNNSLAAGGQIMASNIITAPYMSAAVSGDGIPQPEIIANWTAWNWEQTGAVADMVHYEDGKDYTTYIDLGAYGGSPATYDFPIGAGYGFWVYSEVGGQTLSYPTL